MNIEQLGLKKEELHNLIVERTVRELLDSQGLDEDGDAYLGDSPFATEMKRLIQDEIKRHVAETAEKHCLPLVGQHIEEVVLQETNKWGEKVGTPMTFVEYLVARAEGYLLEPVNYEGKAKAESGSYSWRKSQTRIAHMIDKHLEFSIETAMKGALKNVNSAISTGIAETVKIKLAEIVDKLKVSAEVK